ncbi:tryptophan synthase beta subunit-like PLP-dependent enzyme [Teratosphaeria nubilosa]|uniref:L-serine ammonia-lyase n=1 Tax=Teratosphaeria nubilosa TaxID=161662 RepID=A0A6G1L9T1_9PEZI|nr:tryptophan synthase beta subunit-like PLP-dependent enzyme [Teratosphaeria nubilosa]
MAPHQALTAYRHSSYASLSNLTSTDNTSTTQSKPTTTTTSPSTPPKLWLKTPLIESASLSQAAGCRILLKLDPLQPSGSFKSRGIGAFCHHALLTSANPNATHFYASSGGNAGLACVHAARTLGRPSTVVVPLTTTPMMIAKLRAAGARRILQHGSNLTEADTYMRGVVVKAARERGEEAVCVHPFDDPVTWAGHGTMIEEIEEDLCAQGESAPSVVICSVGGGGLFNGLVDGVEAQGPRWESTTVLGVETSGCDSLAQSLAAGELVTLPGITSQATSLGATRVSSRTFELAQRGRETGRTANAVLSDADAARGCVRFADEERMFVELACGVSIAVCFGGSLERALGRKVGREEVVVVVVCGGSNVTSAMIEGWRGEYGDFEDVDVERKGRVSEDHDGKHDSGLESECSL